MNTPISTPDDTTLVMRRMSRFDRFQGKTEDERIAILQDMRSKESERIESWALKRRALMESCKGAPKLYGVHAATGHALHESRIGCPTESCLFVIAGSREQATERWAEWVKNGTPGSDTLCPLSPLPALWWTDEMRNRLEELHAELRI